jgi:hypothetical protein
MRTHKLLMAVAAMSLCVVGGCRSQVDPDKVAVGTAVQITRQDGGLVEGTLAARDPKTVSVKTGRTTRTVPRSEIADLKVVTPGRPIEPPPAAKFREFTVPDGTPLTFTMETSVSSETSRAGDEIEGRLTKAVRVDDVEVMPEGSVLRGTVTAAQSAGKVKGRASLALHFDSIEVRQERYPISTGVSVEAASTTKKDVATIGIPAAAGAIIGAIIGGGKGAATGAAIGGGGGTAVVLMTEGKPVTFGVGTSLTLMLANSIEIRLPLK